MRSFSPPFFTTFRPRGTWLLLGCAFLVAACTKDDDGPPGDRSGGTPATSSSGGITAAGTGLGGGAGIGAAPGGGSTMGGGGFATGGSSPAGGGETSAGGSGGTETGGAGDTSSTVGGGTPSGGTGASGSPGAAGRSAGGAGGDRPPAGGSLEGGAATAGDRQGGGTMVAGAGAASGQGGVLPAGGGAENSGGGAGSGAGSTGGVVDREQAPYPEADPSDCGESWTLVDNVCCAQYCSDDESSESCSECGPESESCVPVNSKACKSGKWPEVHSLSEEESWHYSRSTHFGLTAAGACAYGLYSLCTTEVAFDAGLQARCDAFCTAYPDLCADPEGVTLRGNYAAPQGNYYSQFWPSLPGDLDNYLSCGECFEVVRTRPDGTEYEPGEEGYAPPIVLQIVDSCPCAANSKWCCGSGRDHCGEISDYAYGCPLPPGPPDPPADHDPLPNESIHLDLSDIAMARLQTGDPAGNMVDGVIPTKYRRVPCPVVGNTYIWLHPAGDPYWFSLSVVNSAGLGSVVAVEARLPSGEWVPLGRDTNYTSSRPQERYGAWVLPQGFGPFELPVSIRLTSPSGEAIVAEDVIKSWEPADPNQRETYYIDTGVQFE